MPALVPMRTSAALGPDVSKLLGMRRVPTSVEPLDSVHMYSSRVFGGTFDSYDKALAAAPTGSVVEPFVSTVWCWHARVTGDSVNVSAASTTSTTRGPAAATPWNQLVPGRVNVDATLCGPLDAWAVNRGAAAVPVELAPPGEVSTQSARVRAAVNADSSAASAYLNARQVGVGAPARHDHEGQAQQAHQPRTTVAPTIAPLLELVGRATATSVTTTSTAASPAALKAKTTIGKAKKKKKAIHECPHCKYTSKRKANLNRHIRTHTNEKPYKCKVPFCTYASCESGALVRHQNRHEGIRPHICNW